MRSKTANKILSETSQETKDKVRENSNKMVMEKQEQKQHLIELMNMKTDEELARALVDKFTFASIYFTDGENGAKINAKECSKLHLQHSIELLEECRENYIIGIGAFGWLDRKLNSLKSQLEHLNSI